MDEAFGGGRPQGQLERALTQVTIGMLQDYLAREKNLEAGRSGEYDQQVEFPISGTAGSAWGSADVPVTWEHPIVYAPTQRTVPFEKPHVSNHIELPTTTELIVATAHVISWNQNDNGWYIGATVRVAVCAPNATDTVPYSGTVHLTFQGYASPTDGDLYQ